MKQCPYCGKQIGDNALFCSKCGKKLPEVKYCSHCGATVNGTDLFCSSCGAKLDKAKTGNDVKVVTEVRNQRPFIHNQPKPYPLSPTPYNSTRKNSTKNIAIWIIIPLVILALIGGGVYFYLNCSSNEQEAKVEIVADGIRTLNGAIGEYPITMELHIEKPNVDGSLYYNKYDPSNKLFVSGSMHNNEIELREHNKDGMETGHYNGKYSNGVFQGEYINYKGDVYSFYLTETEEDSEVVVEEPFETAVVSYSYSAPCPFGNATGIKAEIEIDYPVSGKHELKNAVISFILKSLNEVYIEIPYSGDTTDGHAVVNFYGKAKLEEIQKDECGAHSITIKNDYETDKLVSYKVEYVGDNCGAGGFGSIYGVTFNKEDGIVVQVIKDPSNIEFRTILTFCAKQYLIKNGDMSEDEDMSSLFYTGNTSIIPFPTKEPYITKEGVCFSYGDYELVRFGREFSIPFDKLRPYMTETALSLLEDFKQHKSTGERKN